MAYSMSPMQAAMLLVALVVGTCVGSVNAGHALNAALMQGDKEKMREIIESGAEGVNHMEGGEDGMSALYFATMLDDVDMVEYLLHDLQADPMIGDYRGFRPIDVAAFKGHYEVADVLMELAGEKILSNFVSPVDGLTPLHRAARTNTQKHADTVQAMVERGAKVDTKSSDSSIKPGATALHLAASLGNFDVVKTLMTNGADIEQVDAGGNTVLHAAVQKGDTKLHPRVVDYLLKSGASKTKTNAAGKTAHELGLESKMANTMMKYRVIPGLKVKTEEELEEERLRKGINDEYLKSRNTLYSEASGVKLGSDLRQKDEDAAEKKRRDAVKRSQKSSK